MALQNIQTILTSLLNKQNLKFTFQNQNNQLLLNITNPQNIEDYTLFHIINDNLNFPFSFNTTINNPNLLQITFTI